MQLMFDIVLHVSLSICDSSWIIFWKCCNKKPAAYIETIYRLELIDFVLSEENMYGGMYLPSMP